MANPDKDSKTSRSRTVLSAFDEKTKETQSPLIARIWVAAASKNESAYDLAENLGFSYPYLIALARGERPTEKLGREHIVRIANYLDLPVGQVYLLAGVLKPEDFIFEPTQEEKIQRVLDAMSIDPLWAAYVPKPEVWHDANPSLKLLVCLLYERGARTSFFDDVEIPVYSDK